MAKDKDAATLKDSYDVVVLGAGPGGYVAAIRAAQLGLETVCVEAEDREGGWGGCCLNWGCIPAKAILESAALAHRIRHEAAEFGVKTRDIQLDIGQAVARSRTVSERLSKGISYLFRKNKVTPVRGRGRLGKGKRVEIALTDGGEAAVTARKGIIVATGSRAKTFPGFEFDGERVFSSREALDVKKIPQRMVIVGAGAVGVEFADVFNAFGSEVTILEALPQILPVEDAEVAKVVEGAFRKRGMKISTGTKVKELDRSNRKTLKLSVEWDGKEETIETEAVLMAVGRAPNVEEIGLEEAGVKLNGGFIMIDELCRTTAEGIYAVGDVAGPPMLAHKGRQEPDADALRQRAVLHLLPPRGRERRPHGAAGEGGGARVHRGQVPVQRERARADRGGAGRVREDHRRQEVRRGAGRPHRRAQRDGAHPRAGARPRAGDDGGGDRPHDPRAPDPLRGGGRGRARGTRPADPHLAAGRHGTVSPRRRPGLGGPGSGPGAERMRRLVVVHLPGLTDYAAALEWQRALAAARADGTSRDDLLVLLQHPPVITLGRGAHDVNLVADADALRARGVPVFEVERGGDVTYHGHGQLVGYPILHLEQHRKDLHWYLRRVEEALIKSCADFGVEAGRSPGYTGVWVPADAPARKIASIGVHVARWVTRHGFALNVTTDLSAFDLIVACGIPSVQMTSIERETGEAPDWGTVTESAGRRFAETFELEPEPASAEEVAASLGTPVPR